MSVKTMPTPSMTSLESGNGDDSFVILGSSPPQSMIESTTVGTSMSIIQTELPPVPEHRETINDASLGGSPQNGAVGGNESIQGHSSISSKPVSLDKSFASKIILGQVDCKSLQTSLFQQFPSLGSSHVQMDDIMKLSCMVEEHQQLKENLEKTNITMRRQFTVLQEWQDTVKRRMLEKNETIDKLKQELTSSQSQNERLNKELGELKRNLDETLANFNAYQVSAKKEISDMTMKLSEKDSIIQNIHAENERLQLEKADFVVLQKNKPETSFEPTDFIKKTEHDALMKDMRHQLSDLMAQNLEFQDMKKVYMDELNCLKVNLTAAEELHRDMRDTITTLRLRDEESRKRAEENMNQVQAAQDENALLKVQVEVYQKDFQMEREAREKLVTEKENILSELQLLKMRNKQLIDDAQESNENSQSKSKKKLLSSHKIKSFFIPKPRLNSNGAGGSSSQGPVKHNITTNGATAPTSASRSSKSSTPESENQKIRYICPICNQEMKTLRLLEQHIDICLKD